MELSGGIEPPEGRRWLRRAWQLWRDRKRRLFRHPTQEKAAILLAVSTPAGLVIWLFPMLFDDPRSVRLVTITALLGVSAIALALRVYLRLELEVIRQRMAPRLAALEKVALERRRGPDRHGPPGRKADGASPGLRLVGVDLRGAVLADVDLPGADLTKARLDGADLRRADLTGADLRGARLTDADLRDATLAHALYDGTTVWPASIPSPEKVGAIRFGELP
jgi:hypothetical protein